jgi:ABC-type lipoprotein export system ATPase subunit
VVVTHDPEIAAIAETTIRLKDGQVVDAPVASVGR